MWVNLGEEEVHVPDIRHGRCDNISFMRLPCPKITDVHHVLFHLDIHSIPNFSM